MLLIAKTSSCFLLKRHYLTLKGIWVLLSGALQVFLRLCSSHLSISLPLFSFSWALFSVSYKNYPWHLLKKNKKAQMAQGWQRRETHLGDLSLIIAISSLPGLHTHTGRTQLMLWPVGGPRTFSFVLYPQCRKYS